MTTITLPRATVEQALEALEWHLERGAWGADIEGVTGALRAALAQHSPATLFDPRGSLGEPIV